MNVSYKTKGKLFMKILTSSLLNFNQSKSIIFLQLNLFVLVFFFVDTVNNDEMLENGFQIVSFWRVIHTLHCIQLKSLNGLNQSIMVSGKYIMAILISVTDNKLKFVDNCFVMNIKLKKKKQFLCRTCHTTTTREGCAKYDFKFWTTTSSCAWCASFDFGTRGRGKFKILF